MPGSFRALRVIRTAPTPRLARSRRPRWRQIRARVSESCHSPPPLAVTQIIAGQFGSCCPNNSSRNSKCRKTVITPDSDTPGGGPRPDRAGLLSGGGRPLSAGFVVQWRGSHPLDGWTAVFPAKSTWSAGEQSSVSIASAVGALPPPACTSQPPQTASAEACRHCDLRGRQSAFAARSQSDTPNFRYVHSVIATMHPRTD